mmetsp:Transcript_11733/g.30375  ORF Transcript_11733/g.30375 Transcript_11733/m.30375 type:complete len:211 (+) Transcript_11733:427-1059(+)
MEELPQLRVHVLARQERVRRRGRGGRRAGSLRRRPRVDRERDERRHSLLRRLHRREEEQGQQRQDQQAEPDLCDGEDRQEDGRALDGRLGQALPLHDAHGHPRLRQIRATQCRPRVPHAAPAHLPGLEVAGRRRWPAGGLVRVHAQGGKEQRVQVRGVLGTGDKHGRAVRQLRQGLQCVLEGRCVRCRDLAPVAELQGQPHQRQWRRRAD